MCPPSALSPRGKLTRDCGRVEGFLGETGLGGDLKVKAGRSKWGRKNSSAERLRRERTCWQIQSELRAAGPTGGERGSDRGTQGGGDQPRGSGAVPPQRGAPGSFSIGSNLASVALQQNCSGWEAGREPGKDGSVLAIRGSGLTYSMARGRWQT